MDVYGGTSASATDLKSPLSLLMPVVTALTSPILSSPTFGHQVLRFSVEHCTYSGTLFLVFDDGLLVRCCIKCLFVVE